MLLSLALSVVGSDVVGGPSEALLCGVRSPGLTWIVFKEMMFVTLRLASTVFFRAASTRTRTRTTPRQTTRPGGRFQQEMPSLCWACLAVVCSSASRVVPMRYDPICAAVCNFSSRRLARRFNLYS